MGVRIFLMLKEIKKTSVKNTGMSEYIVAKRKPSRINVYRFVGPTNSLARDMLKFLAPFQNDKHEIGTISLFFDDSWYKFNIFQQLSTQLWFGVSSIEQKKMRFRRD